MRGENSPLYLRGRRTKAIFRSGNFPRVTMCDFNVRVLGNIHRWTVQCVLMINMFNEKIFVFFWYAPPPSSLQFFILFFRFWFLFVGVLSFLSLVYWTFATLLPGSQRAYVSKYLRCVGSIGQFTTHREERVLDHFVRNFLRTDGVFLLRMIQVKTAEFPM